MRLLVLGGTAFVGRHFTAAALEHGHEVTLLTRGITNPGLFPAAEHLVADREHDLATILGSRRFDAAVDTCGYVPRVVRASAGLLADRVETYAFISTISVYDDAPSLDESSETRRPADPASEDVAAEYGGLKALCELAVEQAVPGRALVVRPGLVVGPHDYTGRFSYWPHRIAQGGEVLAPAPPEARVWFIDARDLAAFVLALVERRERGVFNAVGPAEALSLGALLDVCIAEAASDAELTWVSEEFLLANDVAPFTELPLWIPAGESGHPVIDIRKALAAGLVLRPVSETIRALQGLEPPPAERVGATGPPRHAAGLSPERERALLEAWHASR